MGPAPPRPPLDADIDTALAAIDARRSLRPAEAADIEHPLVVRTRRLAARGPDPRARDPYGRPLRDWIEVQAPLWIAATTGRIDAALGLADAIFRELDHAGFATAPPTRGESPHSVTSVLGHEFILRVRERLTKRRHDPERDPPRDKWDVAYGRKEDVWKPNGHIEVEVRRPGDRCTRKRWSGSSRTSTGERAVAIVRALVLEVQEARREAEAARIRHLEWEAERKRREIEETRRRYDQRQVELLEETINRWLRAEAIWRFARAGRAAAVAAGGANEREEAWLRWVEAVAKRNDPYGEGVEAVIRATTPGFERP